MQKSEVLAAFGKPQRTATHIDGSEDWYYSFVKTTHSASQQQLGDGTSVSYEIKTDWGLEPIHFSKAGGVTKEIPQGQVAIR